MTKTSRKGIRFSITAHLATCAALAFVAVSAGLNAGCAPPNSFDGGDSSDAGPVRDDGGPLRCGLVCPASQVCRLQLEMEACVGAVALICESDRDCTDGNDEQMRCLGERCVDDVRNDPSYCGDGVDGSFCRYYEDENRRDSFCASGFLCFTDTDAYSSCEDGTCRPEQGDECVEDTDCEDGPNYLVNCFRGYCFVEW